MQTMYSLQKNPLCHKTTFSKILGRFYQLDNACDNQAYEFAFQTESNSAILKESFEIH